jgi:hypothetical protein
MIESCHLPFLCGSKTSADTTRSVADLVHRLISMSSEETVKSIGQSSVAFPTQRPVNIRRIISAFFTSLHSESANE